MLTKIEITNTKKRTKQIVKGKLLGLITDKQYAIISKDTEIRRKLFTGETVLLKDVSSILLADPFTTYRVVVNAKYIDGVSGGKHLFITGRLNTLTKCIDDTRGIFVETWPEEHINITMSEV